MNELAPIIRRRRERLAIRQGYRALLLRVLLIALVLYLIFTQVFLLTQARGMDMFPAVKDGDLLVVFRMQKEYQKNDVVVFTADGRRRIGRIAARETDYVVIDEDGVLRVNGTVQSGEILYPTYPREGAEYPQQVPEGCLYILGDYRTNTTDSRDFGPVPMDRVQGKVITVLRRRGL